MVILSASPHRCFAPKARVSSSPSSSSCSHLKSVFVTCTFAVPSTVRRWRCAVSYCSSEFKGMAEMVKDKESAAAADMAVFGSESDDRELSHCRTFLDARTEQELISGIRKEMESGSLPLNVARAMEELYQTYRNAVIRSGNPKAEEVVLSNMAAAFDRIFMDVKDPFVFSPYHKAVREPFDYYLFVQNYIRPLIDFRNSYVGNIPLFYEIEQKLQQGENVVFVSNHQTEADPAVIALLLETTNPNLAENMTFVAGDRVITDPLCKPFSIGRNLLCVYSKNHLYDVPELAESKKKANTRSLKEMALLLRGGSKIIWIAPSGGRDRPDPVTNEWLPAPFDASAVDNMRRLVQHAGVPGHIYPLAILCHDIMPPPPQVEKEIGERRVICFHGTGISVAPKISFDEITATCEDPAEAKVAYTEALYESVNSQYDVLKSAVHRKQGLEASTPTVSLSQPWI